VEAVIDRNKLLGYNEKVSKLKFALIDAKNDAEKTQRALASFLNNYLQTVKFQKNSIDAQNFYFSRRMVNDFLAIVAKYNTLDSKTIDSYVNNAIKSLDLSDYFIDGVKVKQLSKKLTKAFDEILSSIEKKESSAKKKTETKDESTSSSPEPSASKSSKSEKFNQSKYVKDNPYKTDWSSAFDAINEHIKNNVFKPLNVAVNEKIFSFSTTAGIAVKTKAKTSLLRNFFTKVWNPKVSDIIDPVKTWQDKITTGYFVKAKDIVKNHAKKFFKALDDYFPVLLLAKFLKFSFIISKFAFKLASRITHIAVKVVLKSVSFAASTIKTITGYAVKIGSKTISVLSKIVKRIATFSVVKFSFKMILTFLKSYVGAYLFGYFVGTLYSHMKGILEFAKGVYTKISEYFTTVKDWTKEHVYDPYIDKVLGWLEGKAEDSNFYLTQISNVFNDPEINSFAEKAKEIANLFALQNKKGETFYSKEIVSKIAIVEDGIRALEDFDLSSFLVVQGGRMLGGIAGARLGAVMGQALIPIPVVGAVIGSLLGGWAGDKLGGVIGKMITARSPFKNVESEEDPIEKYVREQIGYESDVRREAIFGSGTTTAPHLALLKTLGKKAERGEDWKVILGSNEAKDLKRFGIDVEAQFSGENAREDLALFSKIGERLSYSKLLDETRATLKEFTELIDKGDEFSPRGFLNRKSIEKYGKLKNYGETEATLSDKSLHFHSGPLYNPYWLKTFRNMLVIKKLRELQTNKINPNEFVAFMEKVSGNIDQEEFNRLIDGFYVDFVGEKTPAKVLLYGSYFKAGGELNTESLTSLSNSPLVAVAHGAKAFRVDDVDALKSDTIVKNAMKDMFAFVPIDKSSWYRAFVGRLKEQDFSQIFNENLEPPTASDIPGFKDMFDKVTQEMQIAGQTGLENINADDIAFRLAPYLGTTGTVDETMIRASILQALEKGGQGRNNYLFDELLRPLQQAINNIGPSANQEEMSKALEEQLAESAESDGLRMTLRQYQEFAKNNNEFYVNVLIPALREMIEKEEDQTKKQYLINILKLNSYSGSSYSGSPLDGSIQPNAGVE